MAEIQGKSADPGASRVKIGAPLISILGVIFGVSLIIGGSFMTWRSDTILDLFNRTGWRFQNLLTAGDGKLSLALGIAILVAILLGGALRNRWLYAATLGLTSVVIILFLYELIFLMTRPGVVSPGTGLFALLGGSIITIMCALGGYLMVR